MNVSRRMRRSVGRRERIRRRLARGNRVVELSEAGYSPEAIARSTALSEETVIKVLARIADKIEQHKRKVIDDGSI